MSQTKNKIIYYIILALSIAFLFSCVFVPNIALIILSLTSVILAETIIYKKKQ